MSQHLDARQRAMLQEMGITIWAPAAPPAMAEPALAPAPSHHLAPAVAPASLSAPMPIATPAPAPAKPATVQRPPVTAAAPVPPDPEGPVGWKIAPAVQPYPSQATGQASEDGWLVLLESASPLAPLAGDVGRLLDQMLRALDLQTHPQLWIAGLQRPDGESLPVAGDSNLPVDWQPLDSGLQAAIERSRPARVLVLGLHTARAVLGRNEPLGQLRALPHQVLQVPAMVSYDPAYLLRADHAKPAAWADLCRASQLARPPAS